MFKLRASDTFVALFQTTNLNILVFALGLIFGLTGATLIDLGDIYVTTPKVVSYIITTRGCGAIVFCFLAQFIYRYVNIQQVMTVSTIVACIGLTLTPLLGNLKLCHFFTFLVGGSIGLMETGTNVWVIALWKKKSGPVFQFINFCFGLGGVIAPFAAGPFLSKKHDAINVTESLFNETNTLPYTADTQVFIPYAMLGSVFGLVSILMMVSYCFDNRNRTPEDDEESIGTAKTSICWERCMVFIFCIYIFSIVGLEQTYISMLAVYTVEQLDFSKQDSVNISAVFWIFFTCSRVVATYASMKMRPKPMLYVCHTTVLVGGILLAIMGGHSPISVWICTALIGFGVSPMFPTALTHAMEYVLFSHTYMSYVMLCVCIGAMIPPILVGPFIESNPIAFAYINCGITILTGLLMVAIVATPRGRPKRAVAQK